MNPLNAQGLQSSPLTNPAAASSSQASFSSSTDEKITQVVGSHESGSHQAVAASSQSLEGRKLSQENPPPVVLDLSDEGLWVGDRIAYIQNSGGTVTLLKLGENSLPKELLKHIAEFCPQLKELELHTRKWGLDQLIQVQSTLPKGVLLTNTYYGIPNRNELQKYLDYCAPFGGPTCLNLEEISDLTQSELDELIERAPKLRRLSVCSNKLTELNAPNATEIDCSGCTNLLNLDAPCASEICCGGCTRLQSLIAPKAEGINCRGCTRLQSISAPKATAIGCSGCPSLQSISAPTAIEIYCQSCTGLQNLNTPCATKIYCRGCTGLQSISAPEATWIDSGECTGLQSISAPKATAIDCSGCTDLQNLKVPLAAIVGWKGDPLLSLEMLQMGAEMPDPEEMESLETSHPELAQKMRKLTVLTLQDLVRNCIHRNPQKIETKDFPAPLLQYEDIETAYLARPESKTE